jgi:hypothetical protein
MNKYAVSYVNLDTEAHRLEFVKALTPDLACTKVLKDSGWDLTSFIDFDGSVAEWANTLGVLVYARELP